jgi:hypothetical protein
MRRVASRIAIAVTLLGLGWTAGRAQSPQPDFELIINAPAGNTTVQCARGCRLMWVERGVNPYDTPQPSFSFACQGLVLRCSSARIGGWLKD